MDIKDISVGVTAFIDILGFGDKVLEASTVEAIGEINSRMRLIRDAFDFEAEDELTLDVQRMHGTTVLAFSDCVIVNIPLESDVTKYDGTFDPIMSEITNFALGQGHCSQNGLFIRGGVDLGWWHQQGSTLISQSMVRAYRAEGSACMPVIALTKQFYEYFSQHKHREFYSKDIDPILRTFRTFSQDSRQFHYIDYITICLESLDWQTTREQVDRFRVATPDTKNQIMNEGYHSNVVQWLERHARNIEDAYAAATLDKVRAKYSWLSTYHNEIAADFTTADDCFCDIT